MISTSPYTGGEAVEWWREAARYGDLIREVYFKAPNVRRLGPLRGNRYLRDYFRRAAAELIAIGISPRELGLMLGFHTTPGTGGREGLQPARAWYEVVKRQALSARHVAKELGLASIWSWGWRRTATRNATPRRRARPASGSGFGDRRSATGPGLRAPGSMPR